MMKELHLSYQDIQVMPMEYLEWFYDRQLQFLIDEEEKRKQQG